MFPAYPGIPILGHLLPLFSLDQGPIRTISGTDTTVVASIGEGDLIFVLSPNQPPNCDSRLRGIKGLFKAKGTAQLADEASCALCRINLDWGLLPTSYQNAPPIICGSPSGIIRLSALAKGGPHIPVKPHALLPKELASHLFQVIGDDQIKFSLVQNIPLQIYPRGNLLVILILAGIQINP